MWNKVLCFEIIWSTFRQVTHKPLCFRPLSHSVAPNTGRSSIQNVFASNNIAKYDMTMKMSATVSETEVSFDNNYIQFEHSLLFLFYVLKSLPLFFPS